MMNKKPRKAPRKISSSYLENAALYYLQRHASSAANFRRVMERKIKRSCLHHGDDPGAFLPLVDDLVRRYAAVGLLDDDAFARAKTSSLRRKGLSRQGIVAKLSAKGLTRPDIESALESTDESEDAEFEAALRLAKRKKIGPFRPRPLEDPAGQKKEMAVLARAGFSFDVAKRVLEYDGDEI